MIYKASCELTLTLYAGRRRNALREAEEYLTRTAHFRRAFNDMLVGEGHDRTKATSSTVPMGERASGVAPNSGKKKKGQHVAVWLFSYPNSGTTWMQDLIEHAVGVRDSAYKGEIPQLLECRRI